LKALRLQAERRLGEMLRLMPKATGAKGVGPIAVPSENRNQTPTLADIGITKKTSMRAQQLAAMPAAKFALVASGELSVSQATAAPRVVPVPILRMVDAPHASEDIKAVLLTSSAVRGGGYELVSASTLDSSIMAVPDHN
jgi:hypothetical protein